jgi:hypothetical protein
VDAKPSSRDASFDSLPILRGGTIASVAYGRRIPMATSCALMRVVAYSATQWTQMQHNTRKRTQSEF